MRFVFAILAGVVTAGAVYQRWGTYRDRKRLQLPGKRLMTEKGSFYVHQQGRGSPAVVLESGLAASSLSWTLVQPQIAELTRTCSYDRAGFGWSGPTSRPRTAANVTTELQALLRASVPPPYILVGHSFGGLLVRHFAHSYPAAVAGIVLVDPVSLQYWAQCGPDDEKRLQLAAKLSRRGAVLARLGIVRLALVLLSRGRTRLPQWIARTSSGKANNLITRLTGEIRRLPPEVWPLLRAHWSRSSSFKTMAAYLQNLPQSARETESLPIPAHMPLTVISAASATETEIQERERWVNQSDFGEHIRLSEGGHWIQLEHPQVVITTIAAMLKSLRTNLVAAYQ